MLSFTKLFQTGERYRLEPATLTEARGDVPNPGRGWYHIYTYTPGNGINCDLPPFLYEGETLALVLIDIGAYRERPLDREGLDVIGSILDAFTAADRDMILRIVYDTEGKGMEKEPSFAAQVRQHIEQLAPLLVSHADNIRVYQGLLVGSWGEMHSSKFVTEKYLKQLADAFLTHTEGKLKLAVRKPVQYRMLIQEDEEVRTRIGFFDDAMFSDETHLGTFGTQPRSEAGWKEPWRPEDELCFMTRRAQEVPFGGEALCGEGPLSPEETVERLRTLRVSYLNCVHDGKRIQEWKEQFFLTEAGERLSLYEYIGAHMGYRFVVSEAKLDRKGKEYELVFSVANKGFACACDELELMLYISSGEQEECLVCPGNPGQLCGGERMEVRIPVAGERLREGSRIYLGLRRKADGRELRFANNCEGERLFLGLIAHQGAK